MGFLDWLLGRRDPSAAWIADPRLALEVDLTSSTICGAGLGSGFGNLAGLGPPENPWPSRDERYAVWETLHRYPPEQRTAIIERGRRSADPQIRAICERLAGS